jgi:microcin C transport system permease protein
MTSYFIRRLLLVPPTFLAITLLVYTVLRLVPGGPVEQAMAQMKMGALSGEAGGSDGGGSQGQKDSHLSDEGLEDLQRYYSLDRSILVGYLQWLGAWPREKEHRIHAVPVKGYETTTKILQEAYLAEKKALVDRNQYLDKANLTFIGGVLHRSLTAKEAKEAQAHVSEVNRLLEISFDVEMRRVQDYLKNLKPPLGVTFSSSQISQQPLGRGSDHNFVFWSPTIEEKERAARATVFAQASFLQDAYLEALKARKRLESETGYELLGVAVFLLNLTSTEVPPPDRLRQLAFRPLYRVHHLKGQAQWRLTRHLQKKGWIDYGGHFYQKVTPLEQKSMEMANPAFIKKAKTLTEGGPGKLDDLFAHLESQNWTVVGTNYYSRITDAEKQKDPVFFQTAQTLLEVRERAGEKLDFIHKNHNYKINSKGLLYRTESRFSGVLQFDFGRSYQRGEPVLQSIYSKFEISLWFGLIGFFMSWIVCVPLGILKAIRHRTTFDTLSSVLVFLGYSIPGFILCLLLITHVAVHVDWIPLGGHKPDNFDQLTGLSAFLGRVRHMMIPIAGYMVGSFATMTILMKNSLMENLGQDYVRTAFAKGLTERRVIFVHALRNSLIPITASIGHALSLLFAGSFLIEKTCNIDGMGLMGFNAIKDKDFPIIMGTLVFGVIIRLTGNILSDLIWALIDPRIRFGK